MITLNCFLYFDFSSLNISPILLKASGCNCFLLSITKCLISFIQIAYEIIAFYLDYMIKKKVASMMISRHRAEKYRKKQKYNVSVKALCNSMKS